MVAEGGPEKLMDLADRPLLRRARRADIGVGGYLTKVVNNFVGALSSGELAGRPSMMPMAHRLRRV